jgi:hypothetical protein
LAQLAKNFAESNCWLQISLLLLEELSRKRTIVSSYSCGKYISSCRNYLPKRFNKCLEAS